MPSQIFTNIPLLVNATENPKQVRGSEMKLLPSTKNAYLVIEDGEIAAYGKAEEANINLKEAIPVAADSMVMPAWCDSHTHLVFAGSRENEFVKKIQGKTYAAIAAEGGGILNSAQKLNDTSEDELFLQGWKRIEEVSKHGTGAIEIKSGYGLTVAGELKMLRVIKKLKEKSNLTIKSTFLGAHAFPSAFQHEHEKYIDLLINQLLPVIAEERLADFIDVFCEKTFFSPEEMERICNAGKQYDLVPKLHVNQLYSIGGVQKGIKLNALSLDHLEILTQEDINDLGKYHGTSTLLPGASFFLRMPPASARELIEAGAAIAIASDYNPGSSPCGNMNFMLSLACIQLKMLPEEAINAATINGAFAMQSEDICGSITRGKKANLIFTKPIPSLSYLPYAFAQNHIDKVMINGSFT